MTYAQAVQKLESLGIMPEKMPSLEPMQRALRRSGLLGRIDPAKNIVVAGTNGKGSVSATLSALLHSAGRRTGLYTSPHLVTTRERFRIAERDLSESEFTRAYESVAEIIEAERLTHFEALTLIAAHVFFSGEIVPPVEWAIWEVGLGGLFDATNAVPHSFCALTRLGLDHQNILGRTLPEIALQKFGVIGREATVAYSPMPSELDELRERIGREKGCRWIPAERAELAGLHKLHTRWGSAEMTLCGPRAAENTATALTLFEQLGFRPEENLAALGRVRWPGRFQRARVEGFRCPVYLSGDHNLQGIESLLEILAQLEWRNLHLIAGIGRDKDAAPMLGRLLSLPRSQLYLTETPFKPLRIAEYPAELRARAALAEPDPRALAAVVAERAGEGDLVVITGSLYLVGLFL